MTHSQHSPAVFMRPHQHRRRHQHSHPTRLTTCARNEDGPSNLDRPPATQKPCIKKIIGIGSWHSPQVGHTHPPLLPVQSHPLQVGHTDPKLVPRTPYSPQVGHPHPVREMALLYVALLVHGVHIRPLLLSRHSRAQQGKGLVSMQRTSGWWGGLVDGGETRLGVRTVPVCSTQLCTCIAHTC